MLSEKTNDLKEILNKYYRSNSKNHSLQNKILKKFNNCNKFVDYILFDLIKIYTSYINFKFQKKIDNKYFFDFQKKVDYNLKSNSFKLNVLIFINNSLHNFLTFLRITKSKKAYFGINIPNKVFNKVIFNFFFTYKFIFKTNFIFPIPIKEYKETIKLIKEFNLSNNINIPLKIFEERFYKLFNFINNNQYTDNKVFNQDDIFLTGSNVDLISYIFSSNFLKKKIKVYSFSHHYASLKIYNDFWTKRELSKNSKYFDYGLKEIDDPINIIKFNSPLKSCVFKQTNNSKVLYIPTSFSTYNNYGPFRSLNGIDYFNYQKLLINYATKFDIQIDYKYHPKNNEEYYIENTNLISGDLEKVIKTYDFVLLDHISIGSFSCILQNKKILFIDMNIRDINYSFMKSFKQYCFYYQKVDSNKSLYNFFKYFNSNKDKVFQPKNVYLKKYFFNENNLKSAISSK